MSKRVVIVGAGLAGLKTCERLRRNGYDGEISLIGDEDRLPYDRPPLSKALLKQTEVPELPALIDAAWLVELNIDAHMGIRVKRIDTEARSVDLSNDTRLTYDQLIIASGVRARTVTPWESIPQVHSLRTFEDCLAVHDAASQARSATVIGAGVLGSEIASSLTARGLDVTLTDQLPSPLHQTIGQQMGGFVERIQRNHGVEMKLGTKVARVESKADSQETAVTLDDGSTWCTDMVITAIGSAADLDWLADSKLELAGGVVVDEYGATNISGVWAVGDIASHKSPDSQHIQRFEHWASASDMARSVGDNVSAALGIGQFAPFNEIPYFWSDQFGIKIQRLGIPTSVDDVVELFRDTATNKILTAYVSGGKLDALASSRMPGPLMRCKTAVEQQLPIKELMRTEPWK